MAITRTAKGTVAAKTGLTSTISSVSLSAGSLLIVGLSYETDGGNPTSVKWGKRELKIVADTTETRGDTRCRIYRTRVRSADTRDIVATWATDPTARAMFATELKEVGSKHLSVAVNLAAATSHDTTSAGTSTIANSISIGCFATGGPSTDLASVTAGYGHTIGQTAGTTGGADGTNVSITETYEILSATGDIRASISSITSRLCACTVAAFVATETYTVDEAYYIPYDAHPNMERVEFVMKDSSGSRKFRVGILREEFDNMTDAQVEDRIRQDCEWWHTKYELSETSPDFTADATFNTRVSSFENDDFPM